MHELNIHQIEEAVDAAVEKTIPLTLSVHQDGWRNLHSRFLQVTDRHLLVELPGMDSGPPYEFVPAERIGLGFKLKHHKYLGSARVAGIAQFTLRDGTNVPVLRLCYPTHMQRVQRRSYSRMEIPPGRIVRACFWEGNHAEEPPGGEQDGAIWWGRVLDLSAGGFRVFVEGQDPPNLAAETTCGVRVSFGAGEETVYADAQFRHMDKLSGGFELGFQFVGLGQTPQGRGVLTIISQKMNELSRQGSYC
jgi:hypothetical protein